MNPSKKGPIETSIHLLYGPVWTEWERETATNHSRAMDLLMIMKNMNAYMEPDEGRANINQTLVLKNKRVPNLSYATVWTTRE